MILGLGQINSLVDGRSDLIGHESQGRARQFAGIIESSTSLSSNETTNVSCSSSSGSHGAKVGALAFTTSGLASSGLEAPKLRASLGAPRLGELGVGALGLEASAVGESVLGASGNVAPGVGASGVGASGVGASQLGASRNGESRLKGSVVGASRVGQSGVGLSGVGASGIGTSGVRASGLIASGVGASTIEASSNRGISCAREAIKRKSATIHNSYSESVDEQLNVKRDLQIESLELSNYKAKLEIRKLEI